MRPSGRPAYGTLLRPAPRAYGFWQHLRKLMGFLPFSEDVAAAAHCARDVATPFHIRLLLGAAFAYFVFPFDLVPDVILGLGYVDDAALLAAAIGIAKGHITEIHRAQARRWLFKAEPLPSS